MEHVCYMDGPPACSATYDCWSRKPAHPNVLFLKHNDTISNNYINLYNKATEQNQLWLFDVVCLTLSSWEVWFSFFPADSDCAEFRWHAANPLGHLSKGTKRSCLQLHACSAWARCSGRCSLNECASTWTCSV